MNVFGQKLQPCSTSPITGFTRTGFCTLVDEDHGNHTVCAVVTEEFLRFTASRGNDLITPRPGFPGLKPGDLWCLCAARWYQAYKAGKAPPVVGKSSDVGALRIVPKEVLERYLID